MRVPLIFAACLLIAVQSLAAADAIKKPNILIIMADDMGYSDLGCYGSEITTPNLDKMASNGLRFTQFYNTARCWPTRSALLTGYYPQQLHMDPPKGRVPAWAVALPNLLKPLGYRSYHSGKWHIPGLPKTCADAGFDHSYRLDDFNHNFNPQKLLEDDQKLPPVPPNTGYYTATAFADHAIRCLKEHAEKHSCEPFFSYLAFNTPHFPLQAPPQDIARYRDRYLAGWESIRAGRYTRELELGLVNCPLSKPEPKIRAPSGKPGVEERIGPGEVACALPWESLTAEQKVFQSAKMTIHAAMVDRIDQEVGRVLAQVKAMGALDNTVIFFLSDNGASAEMLVRGDGNDPSAAPGSAGSFLCLGPGWSTVSNTPFRRHKIWVHEGGISTPLIIQWPDGIAAHGELRHDVGHVIDLVPTVLDLAGTGAEKLPAGAPPLPGKSLVPAFTKDGAVKRDFLFWLHSANRALRVGDWKIVSARNDADTWCLYNLATDRSETLDLSTEQPERLHDMIARWQELEVRFRSDAANGGTIIPGKKPDEPPPAK